jgi:hypothetical protein
LFFQQKIFNFALIYQNFPSDFESLKKKTTTIILASINTFYEGPNFFASGRKVLPGAGNTDICEEVRGSL